MRRQASRPTVPAGQVGALAGTSLAALLLVWLAVVLMQSSHGAGVKALFPIWLWLLPVLGLGALIGWGVAAGTRRLTRGMATAQRPRVVQPVLAGAGTTHGFGGWDGDDDGGDTFGMMVQSGVDSVATATEGRPAAAMLTGVGLGLMVVGGGLLAFIVVWGVLVGLLA